MKVKILGCSGGIGGRHMRTTAMLVDHDILIDAGTGVGDLTRAELAGAADRALTFVMDLMTSLPQIVIALILAAHLGGGELALILALSLTGWVKYARIARATVFSLREREFVTAARLAGVLRSMADWLELDDVVVRPVGTLSGALAVASRN